MDSLRDYFLLDKKPNLTIGVNLSTEELHKAADWVKSEFPVPDISVNKELSKLLIGKSKANFSKEIVDWISEKIKEVIEERSMRRSRSIFLEPSYELDPLTIFRQASRNKKLLVLWPGGFRNNKLSYATPEHTHYRNWVDPGVEIIHI